MINVVTLVFIAWGLTFNIPAHRWDFSIGAIMVLSVIIGGQMALALGLNAYGLLLCCFLVGAVLGAISGLIYVLLGLSAFVTSLGVALLFEAFSYILFDGQGVNAHRQDRHALHDQGSALVHPLGRRAGAHDDR